MRRSRWTILLFVLLLASLATPMAIADPAISPQLEKVVILHYAQADAKVLAPFGTDSATYKLIAKGVHWPNTVSFSVNATGSGLNSNTVRSVLATSAGTWDSQTSFDLFNSPGDTAATSIGNTADAKNEIIWKNIQDAYPGTIAATLLYYNRFTKQITEFDMIFNSYYSWSADTTGVAGKMDLQNIATHELGHVCGLADVYMPKDWSLTMYGYSDFAETYKRTLATGDILGVQKLYGQ